MPPAEPTIITTVEVARRLGYSGDHVRRLCEQGLLEGAYRVGLGGHWRVPLDAVARFIEATRSPQGVPRTRRT